MHDFTVKSSALDLRLILLSNQLRINNSFDAFFHMYIPHTHTLTRLLEKGVRIWEGMV